nr:hypothetical protein [Tanacetum cinerariifolium]
MFLRNRGRQILGIHSYFRRNQSKSSESKGHSKHVVTHQPEKMQRLSCKLATLNIFLSKAAEMALPCLDTLKKVYKQKGLSLDNIGRRSILGNEEIDSGATNLNDSEEGRRTHDTMVEDSPTKIKASGSNDTLAEGKSMEEKEAPEAKALKKLWTEADLWKLYTDRASNEHRSGA